MFDYEKFRSTSKKDAYLFLILKKKKWLYVDN